MHKVESAEFRRLRCMLVQAPSYIIMAEVAFKCAKSPIRNWEAVGFGLWHNWFMSREGEGADSSVLYSAVQKITSHSIKFVLICYHQLCQHLALGPSHSEFIQYQYG